MKLVIVLAALVAAVMAASPPYIPPETQQIEILENEFKKEPDNSYVYKYKTANGIETEETGVLKDVVGEDNKPLRVLVVSGSYVYPDKDGKPVAIKYTADENGFHPEGESIPKAVSK